MAGKDNKGKTNAAAGAASGGKGKKQGKESGEDQGPGGGGAGGAGKLKPASAINARHILVSHGGRDEGGELTLLQCEKHSRKEEALKRLQEGGKFDDVAREFSEDKARQGAFSGVVLMVAACEDDADGTNQAAL